MMSKDLLYSFVLAVSDLSLGSSEGKMSKDIPRIRHLTAGTSNPHISYLRTSVGLTIDKMTRIKNSNVLKLDAQ
jgi:hypothetical protein